MQTRIFGKPATAQRDSSRSAWDDRDSHGPEAHAPRALRVQAFSLLEIMIAIAVLGIGMIMVAAIFPVALTQHKGNIERTQTQRIVGDAQTMLHSQVDASRLWIYRGFVDPDADGPGGPGTTPSKEYGKDSYWYLLPSVNLSRDFGGGQPWDFMPVPPGPPGSVEPHDVYANVINGAPTFGNPNGYSSGMDVRQVLLQAMDVMGQRTAPFPEGISSGGWLSPLTDDQFYEASQHFVWSGFYRRLGNGAIRYAIGICKQIKGDEFAQQAVTRSDVASPTEYWIAARVDPNFFRQDNNNHRRRLPVPWRLLVSRSDTSLSDPNKRNVIFNDGLVEGLGELAPVGSKIMIGGYGYLTYDPDRAAPLPPAGRILTVSETIDYTNDGVDNPTAIRVLEDLSDVFFTAGSSPPLTTGYKFDVWVFPPPVVGQDSSGTAVFGSQSPLMEWKVNL